MVLVAVLKHQDAPEQDEELELELLFLVLAVSAMQKVREMTPAEVT